MKKHKSNFYRNAIFSAHPLRVVSIERLILAELNATNEYVLWCLKERWPVAEKIIITEPFSACTYARQIIKGPWPEAEDIISTKFVTGYDYEKYVVKAPWRTLEWERMPIF